jgi:hypothetical protein
LLEADGAGERAFARLDVENDASIALSLGCGVLRCRPASPRSSLAGGLPTGSSANKLSALLRRLRLREPAGTQGQWQRFSNASLEERQALDAYEAASLLIYTQ